MLSSQPFEAFFRQADGAFTNVAFANVAFANGTGGHNSHLSPTIAASAILLAPDAGRESARPHLQLSSSQGVRVLLTDASAENAASYNASADFPNSSSTQKNASNAHESSTRFHTSRKEDVIESGLHDGFYNGFDNDLQSASALPSPETLDALNELQNERDDDLVRLQNLQNLLEHAGHQVVAWPAGTASLIHTKDLLAFDVVIVQSQKNAAIDALKLCCFLRDASNEAGASLLLVTNDERGSARAARHTAQMLEAGADGVLDGAAPTYEIAATLHTLAQLARSRRELQVTQEQLRLQLQNDDLTNLLNRRFFFQAAHREYERALRTNSELSCLMIDVDHFRRLGENFGFESCDAVLREVACLLRHQVREGDIVARFGEAKFVLLLPDTTLQQAARIGEAIQRDVTSHPFLWQGQTLALSVSIGEATRHTAPDDNETHEQSRPFSETLEMRSPLSAREEVAALLEAADAALFVAKRGVRSSALLEIVS